MVLYLALVMVIADLILHGVRPATIERAWHNMLARPNQSLALRFLLQPTVSTILAIRDGIKDARTGRSPYFWAVVSDPAQRSARLQEGTAATAKIFLIAIALDVIYQIIELKTFYPNEALIVAILLAFVPYLLLRGPVARLARRWRRDKPRSHMHEYRSGRRHRHRPVHRKGNRREQFRLVAHTPLP